MIALIVHACGGSSSPLVTPVTPTLQPCAYGVSPLSIPVSAAGGTAAVTVQTATGCAWNAVSSVSWVTFTGGSSGSGNGQVSLSIAANTASNSRQATITMAQQSVTITQSGASGVVPVLQGNYTFELRSAPGCRWPVSTHRWPIVLEPFSPLPGQVPIISSSTCRAGNITGCGTPVPGNPSPFYFSVSYSSPTTIEPGLMIGPFNGGSGLPSDVSGYSVNLWLINRITRGPLTLEPSSGRWQLLNVALPDNDGVTMQLWAPGGRFDCGRPQVESLNTAGQFSVIAR